MTLSVIALPLPLPPTTRSFQGTAHNQLAVMSAYMGEELPAVYRYLRAVSAPQPFASAGENLVSLFERSRQRFLKEDTAHRKKVKP